jgi:transketolase
MPKDANSPAPVTPKVMADAIRVLAMDAVEAANSGHPGMPMGMADVATVLFRDFLKFDAAAPDWADRDRFVLSAGHGSMLLYALLHLTGVEAVTMEEIRRFRQLGSLTPGHPEYGHTPGVETTTGPLGQGLATAVGMAMAERALNARFGDGLVDHRTWVIAGDGDLMEGVSHEAIGLAGRLKLNRLTVLWDDNDITIDGRLSISETGDQLKRFAAMGWAVRRIDGHDMRAVKSALAWAKRQKQPSLVACRTKIGKGAPSMEGHHDTHGKALGKDESRATRINLGWAARGVRGSPGASYDSWLSGPVASGAKGAGRTGTARLAASPEGKAFMAAQSGAFPPPPSRR